MKISLLSLLKKVLCALFCCSAALSFCACSKKSVDLFSYVSELRNNIFVVSNGELSLKIYSFEKESPYLADGIKRETASGTEFHLTAPSGEKVYELSFFVDGKAYGGDMSFDNVKREYFYYVTLDTSALSSLAVTVKDGDTVYELNAVTVKTESLLPARDILKNVAISEKEYFSSHTKKNEFQGEIYIRLIFESEPYYYVGLVDGGGKTLSLLCDGKTGKILAKREG